MNRETAEETSQLFASVLSNVTAEQWESFKQQQNKLGMLVVESDSDDDSELSERSLSPCPEEEYIANVELIQRGEDKSGSEGSDEENSGSGGTWGCNAAVQYVNGEITFSQLSDILEKETIKPRPRKKMRIEKKPVSPIPESQLEREHREYQMELKNRRKKGRRKMCHLPKDLEGLMGAANLNFANGNTKDAIKMCRELIRLAPAAQQPYQTLAVIYDEMGEPQTSFQYYFIAALLNPSDTEEWIRLAELSIEYNQLQQAITCYTHAIRNDRTNVNFLWERCNLYEQINERKRALIGYERILKHLSNPEDGKKCVDMSREIAKVHYDNTDYVNAIKVLETAFTKFPSMITSEDVNFLLELQLAQKSHKSAIKNCIQHCGVRFILPDREVSSYEEVDNFTEEDFKCIEKCYIPEVLPIDLSVKILVCLIHLKALNAVKPLLESLKSENPEEIGDLYLDVAESFMETGENELAMPLFLQLLATKNYSLPAVWMKFADCLYALNKIEEAVKAYGNVIKMAPSYQDARLALSKIYLDMGKVQSAASILRQEYEDGKEGTVLGLDALYQRCKLLESEGRWEEYIKAGTLIQFSHCYVLECEEEISAVLANQTSKRRNEAIKELKAQAKRHCLEFVGQNAPIDDLWDIFKKVSSKLTEFKRFGELQNLSLSSLTSTVLMKNPERARELEFQALLSCFFNRSYYYAYLLAKDLVIRNINNTKAWNLFCLIITYSQENRHNRFCLRLMMKHQDHLALGYLNGHNAMISGTYKHALGEYMCILKEHPNDSFVTFCVGITFIHMACQKFATKRHFLTIQGFAFLTKYLKLKGECQETYYNVGRALHQLGIRDAAIHYYKRALVAPAPVCPVPVKGIFDLRREIAYNLSLIYQSTGATDLAYIYTRKYIVV